MVAIRNARPGEDVAGFSTTSRFLYAGSNRSSMVVGGSTPRSANQAMS